MASRDDMVIRPSIEEEAKAATPTQARERRHARFGKKKGRLFRKLALARGARRLARSVGVSRGAMAAGTVGRLVSLGAVGVAAAAAVAARLVSGRSFGGMGAVINRTVLGDADERALARQLATQQLLANPLVTRVVGTQGMTSQIYRLHEIFTREHLKTVRGTSRILEHEAFDVDAKLDMLILNMRDKVKELAATFTDVTNIKEAR
jgi:hypothetical protein